MNKSAWTYSLVVVWLFLACKDQPASQDHAAKSAGDSTTTLPPSAQSTPSDSIDPSLTAMNGTLADLAIWMELRLPEKDGKATGTYLYHKHGKDILLSGELKGSSLKLEEQSGGKVTGVFQLEYDYDYHTWTGTWNKPGKRNSNPVRLEKVDRKYKACRMIGLSELTLADGGSMQEEEISKTNSVEEHEEMERSSGEKIPDPAFDITHCRHGLMSAVLTWYYYPGRGPIILNSSVRHTFDLERRTEITLWSEIDSNQSEKFSKFAMESLKHLVDEIAEAIGEAEAPPTGEASSDADLETEEQRKERRELHLNSGKSVDQMGVHLVDDAIHIGYDDYYDERDIFVEVAYADLKPFLRKGSILHNLDPIRRVQSQAPSLSK